MTRAEFIPGVLFRLPGSKYEVHTLREISEATVMIEHCGNLYNEGKWFPYPPQTSFHTEVTKNGFRIWTVTGGIYLNSRVIQFSALTKVEIPTPVTNPTTI
jgi:hypothetical protein